MKEGSAMRGDLRKRIKEGFFVLDCGMGTSLQAAGLASGERSEIFGESHPELIVAHHKSCFDAGSDAVYANTFGICGYNYSKDEIIRLTESALRSANAARDGSEADGREKYVALDVGPTGKMLKPFGELDFEDAVDTFASLIKVADPELYDMIVIETMTDLCETKAAIIAAKENSDKPIFVTNVYGADGRMLTGGDSASAVVMLEGLGVDALGVNCSLAPHEMLSVVRELRKLSSIPIIAKPNAGLPDRVGNDFIYNATPEGFAEEMAELVLAGATIVGGCCGTTPDFISALSSKLRDMTFLLPTKKNYTAVSSFSRTVFFGDKTIPIGERINPTGKKKLKEALKLGDMGYITAEAVGQFEKGALVLDVNVGTPGICEKELMRSAVSGVQSVCELPLQIDSSDPEALEAGMRAYIGKPLVNSVSGKEEVMRDVFPLVKKYGGVLIALTIDDNGIPDDADGRIDIATRIIARAAEYGISHDDIIVDPLAMAVSAEPNAAMVTLECIRRLRVAGIKTSLGVSNVSFGLPDRGTINAAFLSMAMESGLSAAIINPYSDETMNMMRAAEVILARDENCAEFVRAAASVTAGSRPEVTELTLFHAIENGMSKRAAELTEKALVMRDPLDIVNNDIIPALDKIGVDFEKKRAFLPALLTSARAASAAFEKIKAVMPKKSGKFTIVMATVEGDIHDIGKNIVVTLLENYGYNVIDLGKDVAPELVVESAVKHDARLVGLSALMTTTLPAMRETVKMLKDRCPNVKTVVGGAVVNADFAASIGADKYAKDAMETVRYAEELL